MSNFEGYNTDMSERQTLVSVEEYLNTSFDGPDREYVDGNIIERNTGEKDHSRPQRRLIAFFSVHESDLRTYCFPEQRVQVKATRFRVPDICVYVGSEPDEQVFRTPPFLCIEILSRDDSASDLQEKIDDYLSFGVPFVWFVDPRRRTGTTYSKEAMRAGLVTENPAITIPIEDLLQ